MGKMTQFSETLVHFFQSPCLACRTFTISKPRSADFEAPKLVNGRVGIYLYSVRKQNATST